MASFDFAAVLEQWPLLLRGTAATIALTAVSAPVGVALGIACARIRTHGPVVARKVVGGYVELIRNTPFIVQLYFLFIGLPGIGVKMSPEFAAVLAMIINLGAYSAEIVRAGVMTTPKGQIEAARSLAMTESQVFLRVVLPPALKRVWPSLSSQIIIVMLGSAVCGQISVPELSQAANLIHSRNFRDFEAYTIAGLIYLGLVIVLRRLLMWGGRRFVFGR